MHYIPEKDTQPSDELWVSVDTNILQIPGSTITDPKFVKGRIYIHNKPARYAPTDRDLDLVVIGLTEVNELRQGPAVEHSFGSGWRLAGNI